MKLPRTGSMRRILPDAVSATTDEGEIVAYLMVSETRDVACAP